MPPSERLSKAGRVFWFRRRRIQRDSPSNKHPTRTAPPPCIPRRFARQELERKQREYEASLQARMQEEVRDLQQQDGSPHAAPPLASLPLLPYLDAEGKISAAGADAKVGRQSLSMPKSSTLGIN